MSPSRKTRYGFGFDPAESEHYFMVSIPSSTLGDVQISEHLSWDAQALAGKTRVIKTETDERLKVILPRSKWESIKATVASEFNARLHEAGLPKGRWKRGLTPLSRLLGKELVLLAWAVEDVDSSRIRVALINWRGLTPEERWWLFTMTNASTGQALRGKKIGWRKAVQFALTENPVSSAIHPEQRAGLISARDSEERNGLSRQKQETLEDFG